MIDAARASEIKLSIFKRSYGFDPTQEDTPESRRIIWRHYGTVGEHVFIFQAHCLEYIDSLLADSVKLEAEVAALRAQLNY